MNSSKSSSKLWSLLSKASMTTSKPLRKHQLSNGSQKLIVVVTLTAVTIVLPSSWAVRPRWCQMVRTRVSNRQRIRRQLSLREFWKSKTLSMWWQTIRSNRSRCRKSKPMTTERDSMMEATSSTEIVVCPLRRRLACSWWKCGKGTQVFRSASTCRSQTHPNWISPLWAIDLLLNCMANRQWRTWREFMWVFQEN